MKRYPIKVTSSFLMRQAAEGTPELTDDLVAATALAGFDPSFNIVLEAENTEYVGDDLLIDGQTTITDKTIEFSRGIFLPRIGVVGTGIAPDDTQMPWEHLFTSAGAAITYTGTGATSQVKAANNAVSNDLLTGMVGSISPDAPTVQKNYKFFNARATIDLEIEIKRRATLKFNIKGLPVDALPVPEAFPFMDDKLVPDYGTQKQLIMPPLFDYSLKQFELVKHGTKAYNTGTTDLPTPFAGTVKSMCFQKISAVNLYGFMLERFQNSCSSGFDKQKIIADVVITVLEDNVAATWQPDSVNYSAISGAMQEQDFALGMYWGASAGFKVYLAWDKLQLADVKGVEVGPYKGKELTFKNNGQFALIWA